MVPKHSTVTFASILPLQEKREGEVLFYSGLGEQRFHAIVIILDFGESSGMIWQSASADTNVHQYSAHAVVVL